MSKNFRFIFKCKSCKHKWETPTDDLALTSVKGRIYCKCPKCYTVNMVHNIKEGKDV